MKLSPSILNYCLASIRNKKLTIATFTALSLAAGTSALAQTSYTGTASTGTWNSTRWNNTSDTSPYGTAWIANNAASFAAGAYTFTAAGTTGQVVNVGNITLASGATVNFSGAGGTIATSATRTLDIGTGSLLDFGTQAISTAVGTGFIKNGTGVLATAGGAYSGGFTLNAGTVIARGVDAMGGSATNVLTLNGGVVAGTASRSFANTKFGGGIVIGGNVQFGELSTIVTLASSTTNLSFANNVSLGAANRIFTQGNSGTNTFSAIISNTGSGGITFAANANTDGRFDITNVANTFTGNIGINGGEVRFTGDGSMGAAANDIIIDGGRFGKASDATTVTLGAGRDIFVGNGAGTSISSASTGTLIYNNAIANKAGEIGSWAKQGQGTLELGGVSTYSGNTVINNGFLKLTTGNNRLPTGTVVSLGQASSANVGTLNLNGLNQQIAGLASTTGTNSSANKNTVTSTTAATLDINVAEGATSSYGAGTAANSGVITDAISLKKSGLGTQTLGDTNTYTGTTTVDAGKLVINGSISTSTTTVNSTGTLTGSGTVGAVTVKNGGFIAPGNSPGTLNTGNITLEAGSSLGIEIDGATVGTQYDRLNVTGSVSLAGLLSMTMSGSYAPANGTLFFILANDGTDAITGTFSNASVNGGTYTFGSQQFQISYAGNTVSNSFTGGNDVVLQAVPEPASLLLGAMAILTLLRRRR